ncbi:CBS domain-containing protein [Sediminibacterium sp.]|uniref:CBS domain-containing protein n=1 Tax=Sediminibacterium sp. TaxID=1917865 RepID=UPI003F6EBEED
MSKVSNILARKGNEVASVHPNTSVIDALRMMAEKNIGSVVVAENDQFLGILTERDYSRKVILMGRNSTKTPVSEIMSADFPAVTMNDTIEHCMQQMSSRHIRYLPVMLDNKLVGIISMNDVVTETILNQKETITQLENYLQS